MQDDKLFLLSSQAECEGDLSAAGQAVTTKTSALKAAEGTIERLTAEVAELKAANAAAAAAKANTVSERDQSGGRVRDKVDYGPIGILCVHDLCPRT